MCVKLHRSIVTNSGYRLGLWASITCMTIFFSHVSHEIEEVLKLVFIYVVKNHVYILHIQNLGVHFLAFLQ